MSARPVPTDRSSVQYRILGPLDAVRDGTSLELGAPKQRAVLAALLVERGRVVSADRLVDRVWGDDAPPSVTTSLQAYVSNLRRILRDPSTATSPILRRSPGYLIEVGSDEVDAATFLRDAAAARTLIDVDDWSGAIDVAERALSLWRGRVLADLGDEEWARVEGAALEEHRAECSEDLVTALLGAGRLGAAVARAERLRAEEPLRERACWLQMIALYRSGRSVEAFEVYRDHERALADELGLEPAPALRDLYGAMLRQERDLESWPNAAPAGGPPPVVEPEPGPMPDEVPDVAWRDPFVGRRSELAVVTETLRDRAGAAPWVVLTGPAGIGKTRLAAESAAALHREGLDVVRTTCADDAAAPPWWPLRALLRGLGADPDAVLSPPGEVDADAARYVIYERLDRLVADRRGGGRLLVVDDVQWADSHSLGWLSHRAAASSASGPALLLTIRAGVPDPAVERLLALVARRPGSRQIELAPLADDEVEELVQAISGEPVERDEALQIAAQSGGNPFFAGELARVPREERIHGGVPLAVRSVLRHRLTAVDPGVLQVLRIAAVTGDPFDIDLIAAVSRLNRDALADLLDDAADEHLIDVAPDTGAYTFVHGLLRDEVLDGVSAPRRQRLHGQVAEALAAAGDPARRGTHLLAAGPLADATDLYTTARAAADAAEATWLSADAAEWWRHARDAYDGLPSGTRDRAVADELRIAEVAALARAGRRQTVLDAVETGIVDALRDGRTESIGALAAALLRTAGSWPWTYGGEASPLVARLTGVEPQVSSAPAAHIRVLAALAVGTYYAPDRAVPDAYGMRALALARELGDPDVLADALLGRALSCSGVAERMTECADAIAELAALPHRLQRIDDVHVAGLDTMIRMARGEMSSAQDDIETGTIGSDALRLPVARMQFRWAAAALSSWRGELDRAAEQYRHAYEVQTQSEMEWVGLWAIAWIPLLWDRGRLRDHGYMNPAIAATTPWATAALMAVQGDVDEAEALLETTLGHPPADIWTTDAELTLLAHVMADLGLTRHARGVLERMRSRADRVAWFGHMGGVGPVALAMARLHAAIGEDREARALLDVARSLASAGGGVCALVRCDLLGAELGGASRAELLAIARAAETLEMAGIVERARERAASMS